MTTDRIGRLTPDVFTPGGEVSFRRPDDRLEALAALSFIEEVKTDLHEARRECLRRALDAAISASEGARDAHLLVTFAAEPDGVRARTFSPVKALSAKAIGLNTTKSCEVLTVTAHMARWSAEVRVGPDQIGGIEAALFENSHAVLVLGSSESVLHGFLSERWGESLDPNLFFRDTALIAARRTLLVVRVFGAFDDREASADVIGRPESFSSFESSASSS